VAGFIFGHKYYFVLNDVVLTWCIMLDTIGASALVRVTIVLRDIFVLFHYVMKDFVMQEQIEMTLMDGEMGYDAYPVGSCI